MLRGGIPNSQVISDLNIFVIEGSVHSMKLEKHSQLPSPSRIKGEMRHLPGPKKFSPVKHYRYSLCQHKAGIKLSYITVSILKGLPFHRHSNKICVLCSASRFVAVRLFGVYAAKWVIKVKDQQVQHIATQLATVN